MKIIAKPVTILGLAGAVALMTPVLSTAQTGYGGPAADTWAHTVSPAPNGQCWIPTDKPYMEFGWGYWGTCPTSAATDQDGRRARAEAIKPSGKRYR